MLTKLERPLTCRNSSKVIHLVQCPLFTKNNALLAKNIRYPFYSLKTLTTISSSTTSGASSSSIGLTRTTSPEKLNTAIDLLRVKFPHIPILYYACRSLLTKIMTKTMQQLWEYARGGGGGLPYEMDGDARRLA